jgi:hypothetical protein
MATKRTSGPRANALGGDQLARSVSESCRATAEVVWEALADLSAHGVWGGSRQGKGRLLSIAAPAAPAAVGVEFTSTGEDRIAQMDDRSVVTEADPPRALEFVTDSTMRLKKGRAFSDWTLVHRYTIEPTGTGCRVAYSSRVTRASALPGALRIFKVPVLRWLALREATGQARTGVRNLVRMAEQGGTR